MQCHCALVKTESCVCQACQKRRKRREAKTSSTTTTTIRRRRKRQLEEAEEQAASDASSTSSVWQAATFGNHQLEEWHDEEEHHRRRVKSRRQATETMQSAASMTLPISVGVASVTAAQAMQQATAQAQRGLRVRAFLGSDKTTGKVVAVPAQCSSWMEFKALLCTAFGLAMAASNLRVFTDDCSFEFVSLASIRDGDCLCLDVTAAAATATGGAGRGAGAGGLDMFTAHAYSVVLPATLDMSDMDRTSVSSASTALLFSEEEDEEWMRELAEALKDEAAELDIFADAIRDRPPRPPRPRPPCVPWGITLCITIINNTMVTLVRVAFRPNPLAAQLSKFNALTP